MRTHLAAVVGVLLLLTGCGSQPTASDEPSPSSSPSASEPPLPSPAQIVAALPQGKAELHGLKLDEECRDVEKGCNDAGPGKVFVQARNAKDNLVFVYAWTVLTDASWKRMVDYCPQGRYSTKREERPGTSYVPATDGVGTREPYETGPWSGVRCKKTIRITYDDGTTQKFPDEHWIRLRRGPILIGFRGRDAAETKQLSEEYLARLDEQMKLNP